MSHGKIDVQGETTNSTKYEYVGIRILCVQYGNYLQ